jgi:hypothetical protein
LQKNPQIAGLPSNKDLLEQQKLEQKSDIEGQKLEFKNKLEEIKRKLREREVAVKEKKASGSSGGSGGGKSNYTTSQMMDDYNGLFKKTDDIQKEVDYLTTASTAMPDPLKKDNPIVVAKQLEIFAIKEVQKGLLKQMEDQAKADGQDSLAGGLGNVANNETQVNAVIDFIKKAGMPSTDPDLLSTVKKAFGAAVEDTVIREAINRVTGKSKPGTYQLGSGGATQAGSSPKDDPYLKIAKAKQIVQKVLADPSLRNDEKWGVAYQNAQSFLAQQGVSAE